MKSRCLATLFLLFTAVAPSYSQGPEGKGGLEGSWLLTGSTTPAGKKIPVELIAKLKGRFVFTKDGSYEQHALGKKAEAGKYKTDADRKPVWIDLEPTEGPAKGKVQKGILKIDDGQLTIALSPAGGAERPKDFDNARQAEVSTYKRAD